MGTKVGPKINQTGILFCADPANPRSFNVATNALVDVVGNRTMTLGAHTVDATTYGARHFSSSGGESGSGSLDTGVRYGSSSDKIVGADTSFTVCFWVYKTTSFPNNWWHTITDGASGDILTVQNGSPGNFVISMNSSIGGVGASGTYSGVNWASCKDNSWNMLGVRYNIRTQRIDAYVGHPDNGVTFSNTILTDPINVAFKIRNFQGYGYAQSSYHSDNSFSHMVAYDKALLNTDIIENFNQMKTRFI